MKSIRKKTTLVFGSSKTSLEMTICISIKSKSYTFQSTDAQSALKSDVTKI
jgi:hypothetical protein